MKKFVGTSLSAALVFATVSPAMARDYGFYDAYASREDAATAVVDYRIPFGGKSAGKANYGLSLRYGPAARTADRAEGWKPDVTLADLRFGTDGLQRAQVASFNFAQGSDVPTDPRLQMMEGKDSTTWIIIGLVVAGAVVWAVSEDDDDE